MNGRYEIHGRIIERRRGVIVRDETRRATSESLEEAAALARDFVDGGMVAWVFDVRREPGRTMLTYRTVEHLEPPTRRPSRVSRAAATARDRGPGRRIA